MLVRKGRDLATNQEAQVRVLQGAPNQQLTGTRFSREVDCVQFGLENASYSSPWIRAAPQRGFASVIVRIKVSMSAVTVGQGGVDSSRSTPPIRRPRGPPSSCAKHFPWDEAPRYLIHDREVALSYGAAR